MLFDGVNVYTYDAENQLLTIGSGSNIKKYVYDAEGRRVAKVNPQGTGTVLSSYVLGLGGEQVTELDGSGQWVHSNVYADGALIGTYDSTGTHFQLSDWLGTRRMQVDVDGVEEGRYFSYPFGDGLAINGSDATEQVQHEIGVSG